MTYPRATYSHPFPESWPRPDPGKPHTLASRITQQDKLDLYNRAITTRALALKLDVREAYLSHMFPGKAPTHTSSRKVLFAARREYRIALAKRIIAEGLSVKATASDCKVPYRSLARTVRSLKEVKNV